MPVVTLDRTNVVAIDTAVAQNSPTSNYNANTGVAVGQFGTASSVYRGLFKFDLGLVPNDAIINSATLKLTRNAGVGGTVIDIHNITGVYDTNTIWNNQPAFSASSYANFISPASATVSIDLKTLVQEWVNGISINNGFLLKARDEVPLNTYCEFCSLEHTTIANRPTLTIDYTIPTTGKKQVEYVGVGADGGTYQNFTIPLPTGVLAGDLLIAHITNAGSSAITAPNGWNVVTNLQFSTRWGLVAWKFAQSGETNPTFGSPANVSWGGAIYAFRNAKGLLASNNKSFTSSNPQLYPSKTTVSVDNSLFVLLNQTGGSQTVTPPLSYSELRDVVGGAGALQISQRYMHKLRTQDETEMSSTLSQSTVGISTVLALEPITNNPPTDPSGVTKDKSSYTVGDTITVNFTGSTDADGDAITYELDVYDGVSAWTTVATGKAASPITATIPSMVDSTAAKVRVRAVDARGASSNGGESTTFTVAQKDGQILAPVNVVSTAYLVSRMATPVRLSNGWFVGAVKKDTSTYYLYFYVSKNNGRTWEYLSYVNTNVQNFSITSKGMFVYLIYANTSNQIFRASFDATTVGTSVAPTQIESQTSVQGVTSAITPDGNTLWWAGSMKTTSLTNSQNIRAGSIPINADGTLGTPSAVTQVTTLNVSGTDNKNPCVVIKEDGNPVIVYDFYNGTTYAIRSQRFNGSSFVLTDVYSVSTYAQSSPMAIRTPNGKLHVVWHGTDSVSSNYVRYSNSTDGINWSTPVKVSPGTNGTISSDKNGKLFITFENGGYIYRRESVDEFATWTPLLVGVGTMPASLYDPTFQFDFIIPPTFFQGSSSVKYYGSFDTNKKPTVTLDTPDNQTLIEKSALAVSGSATDPDNGNVVTAKYKINNGSARALQSGVSDGSTPISFAKTLTYSGKRMLEGSTDVTGVDLAENVDHTLTVWSEDDKGGKSDETVRKFRVVWNRPPTISDINRDLGTMEAAPSVNYTVTDPETNPFTVTEKINGVVIRSFSGVAGRQETVTIPSDKWLRLEPGVLHTLTIEATDNQGMTSTRMYTLTRFVDKIIFNGMDFASSDPEMQKVLEKFTTDVAAQRILLTPMWDLPPGTTLLIEVCNNAYDAAPTWEDATIVTKLGRAYLFSNTQKTGSKWGINFRFHIEKGTATLPVYFRGVGGAFD